ncbi:MAG: bifunctional nuclease family protein [Candidatus Hydrogenedens sp.]|nr:bifunctional nuclease family protein [Candidatus Hydrogenedentota bacterium]NLF56153.1 bifunctional nuclease family protein [Candidatus Hydrogenedens sp.]
MLEVQILGVTRFEPAQYPMVILRHESQVLFISIGPYEAAAISWGLDHEKPIRPMTHDLVLNILAGLRGELKSVTVYSLENQTFFAYLTVEQRDTNGQVEQVLRIDTRPSDGIAVAVRAGCPVFVAEEVMAQAGQHVSVLESHLEREEGGADGAAGDDDVDDIDDDDEEDDDGEDDEDIGEDGEDSGKGF